MTATTRLPVEYWPALQMQGPEIPKWHDDARRARLEEFAWRKLRDIDTTIGGESIDACQQSTDRSRRRRSRRTRLERLLLWLDDRLSRLSLASGRSGDARGLWGSHGRDSRQLRLGARHPLECHC